VKVNLRVHVFGGVREGEAVLCVSDVITIETKCD